MTRIVSTRFLVDGVREDHDTKRALQALYDVFAAHGMGQATFEVVPDGPARLWVKHRADVAPPREVVARALADAGDYRVVDG